MAASSGIATLRRKPGVVHCLSGRGPLSSLAGLRCVFWCFLKLFNLFEGRLMDLEEFKRRAVGDILIKLAGDRGGMFSVSFGEMLVDDMEEGFLSATVIVGFKFGNIEREHQVNVGWNEDDGIGLEYGEDAQLQPITNASIMFNLYINLALDGLDDKYLQ